MIGWFYMNAPKAVTRDQTTGCPTDGPTALHFVIIDTTDTLPEPAQKQVITRILSLARSLGTQRGDLLELRTINLSKPAGNVIFSRCSPGDGSEESDLTGNPAHAKKRWAEEFFDPLNKLVTENNSSKEADHSPLLEMFQALAVERIEPLSQPNRPVDLLVISDMRQYTDAYSHYTGDLGYQRFRESTVYNKLHTNLGNASLAILYVQRSMPKINERAHIEFWNEWASDNGASLISVERLQGEN